MTQFAFANNVKTTLASSVTSGATTITLSSSANLPTLTAGETFVITLCDAATLSIFEVVYVPYPGISGAVLSGCLRGQEGTTAQNWNTADLAYNGPTAGQMEVMLQNEPFSASSLANPGYVEYPNGLKDQWGTTGLIAGGGTGVQAFAIPFTSAIYSITLGINDNSITAWGAHYEATLSDISITVYGGPSTASTNVSWRAIGV